MGCGYLLAACATIYSIIACIAVWEPLRPQRRTRLDTPRLSILKPLCGAEPETYECLRSFCDQSYPEFQILFGIADPMDPVIPIAERLRREFPHRDVKIVVERRQHGSNRKISNVINMMAHADSDYLVLADSDVRVASDYLANIVGPLLESDVGIVTCPYRGVPRQGFWSVMGSLFINEWFMPSVQVAAMGGSRRFAFGATIALRREVLMRIGGFQSIANHLADDYQLGFLTRELGLRTVLSDVEVEVAVLETSFRCLVEHELRWLRTIRALRPRSYAFCFITFGVPVVLFGTLLSGGRDGVVGFLAVAMAARLLLHFKTRSTRGADVHILVLPLRDLLNLGLWGWSFITRRVKWRDERYEVSRDGSALPVLRS